MNGRAWTAEDLDEIASLEEECFQGEHWTRRMLADSFVSGNFFTSLLKEDGAVVAYGGLSVVLDEAEVPLIAVAEMYRHCGRGGKILDDLIEEAAKQGVKRIFLEVRVSNASAQMLYLSRGFVGIHCRTRYYPDGEDALVMKKEII